MLIGGEVFFEDHRRHVAVEDQFGQHIEEFGST